MHISNSSYAKNLDPVRMKVLMAWFPIFLSDGWWIGLAGVCNNCFLILRVTGLNTIAAHYHYIREIPIGVKYQIRVSIGGWENDKWVRAYLVLCSHTPLRQLTSNSLVILGCEICDPPGLHEIFISFQTSGGRTSEAYFPNTR